MSFAPSPIAIVRLDRHVDPGGVLTQGHGLGGPVDDGAAHPTGQLPVEHLEPVRVGQRDAEPRGERADDLDEPAGDQPDRPAAGGHLGDRARRAGRELDLGEHVLEDRDGQTGERRDALVQRRGEVELAAHGALGDLGDQLLGARAGGEHLDDLTGDERGVDVHDEEAAPGGEVERRSRDARVARCGPVAARQSGSMTAPSARR